MAVETPSSTAIVASDRAVRVRANAGRAARRGPLGLEESTRAQWRRILSGDMVVGRVLIVSAIMASAGAASPQLLSLWPAPANFSAGSARRGLSSAFSFTYSQQTTGAGSQAPPGTMTQAFARYAELTRPHHCAPDGMVAAGDLLTELRVSVVDTSEAPPQQGTAEDYNLTIPTTGAATLRASTIFGAIHGLESFSQLVQFNFSTASYHVARVPLAIQDAPRFVRACHIAMHPFTGGASVFLLPWLPC